MVLAYGSVTLDAPTVSHDATPTLVSLADVDPCLTRLRSVVVGGGHAVRVQARQAIVNSFVGHRHPCVLARQPTWGRHGGDPDRPPPINRPIDLVEVSWAGTGESVGY